MESEMNIREKVENREFNILNLIVKVCLKWKSIVLCGIVLSVLLGGLHYVKQHIMYTKEKKMLESPMGTSEMQLSEALSENAKVYLNYVDKYNSQLAYNEKSVLMTLDPNHFYKGEITFFVDAHFEVEYPLIEKEDPTNFIASAYISSINKGDVLMHLVDQLGLDGNNAAYLSEMIDVNNRFGSVNTLSGDLSKGVITISAYADTKEGCEAILSEIEKTIKEVSEEVKATYGDHDLSMNGRNVFLTADGNLLIYQRDMQERLRDLAYRMSEYAKSLTEEETAYAESYKFELQAQGKIENVKVELRKPEISKKWILVGLVAGMFLAVVCYAFLFIFDGSVHVEDDVQDALGVGLLGRVIKEQKNKKGINGTLYRILYRGCRLFDVEDAVDMVVSNISVLAKKGGSEKVYLIGSTGSDVEKDLSAELATKLMEKSIKMGYGRSILYDSESMEKAAETGIVVIACEPETTTYQELAETIELCFNQGSKVLGVVMLG